MDDDLIADVRLFRLERTQKRTPSRKIVEQIAHLQRRSRRHAAIANLRMDSAVNDDFRSRIVLRTPCAEREMRYAGNGGERFAAKAHRLNPVDILNRPNLARGLPLRRHQRIVAPHAGTVVGNRNQLPASGCNRNINARRPGVQSIFQKLFDNRCRALDNLACGNLVGHILREHSNLCT